MNPSGNKKLRVEMGVETMARLLSGGQVCAADFYCLNKNSKQCLWRLCLECCTQAPGWENANYTDEMPHPPLGEADAPKPRCKRTKSGRRKKG